MAVQVAVALKAAAKAAKTARAVRNGTPPPPRSMRWVAVVVGTPMLFIAIAAVSLISPSLAEAEPGSCPAGTNVPSSVELEQSTIDAVNALKPSYEAVAAEKDVSWAILAGIDYRESGNDPNLSSLGGEPLGQESRDLGIFVVTKEDGLRATVDALRANAEAVYGFAVTSSTGGDDMKAAITAYGRYSAYKTAGVSPDANPYVMSRYDAAHTDMVYPSITGETLAGDTDYRYGAYTVFSRLGGSTSGGCGGLSNIEVVRIAQGEVGVAEEGCDDCGPPLKYQGSTGPEDWCADFVSWVYNEAGSPFTGGQDGGWRLAGVEGMHQWLAANGYYEMRNSNSPPLPGDVIVFGNDDHIGLVEMTDDAGTPLEFGDDTIHTIEGNSSQAVVRHEYSITDEYVSGWGRMREATAA